MAYSQNGWSATPTLIAGFTVQGTQVRVALRKGDSSVVLLELLRRFNREVESLRQSDTGGYNPRSVVGGNSLSNHASGTAVDVRWRDHVLGAQGTFTAIQHAAITRILRDLSGVVRWGGNYRGRKDEMHFEINASAAAVKRVADKIRATAAGVPHNPPKPQPAFATLKKGSKGTRVRKLQERLNLVFPAYSRLKTDGQFGSKMESVIREFQKRTKLEVDGMVGPNTTRKLNSMGVTF